MALPPTQSKTLGKLVVLLEPQFPHLASAGLEEALRIAMLWECPQATTRGSVSPTNQERRPLSRKGPFQPTLRLS